MHACVRATVQLAWLIAPCRPRRAYTWIRPVLTIKKQTNFADANKITCARSSKQSARTPHNLLCQLRTYTHVTPKPLCKFRVPDRKIHGCKARKRGEMSELLTEVTKPVYVGPGKVCGCRLDFFPPPFPL
eukprot:GDKI01019703.1.p1 GENE.GDKI01019703.1~~GDKI01019703.1.p1  ORF type:complete len:130 (+),score=2.64 GDKI01019703.1:321-710(+)